MTETPIDPLPGEGPPQAIPPAAYGTPEPPPTPAPGPEPAPPFDSGLATRPDSESRTWGMLTHLISLSALIGVPFGNLIGPLIMWQIKKELPFVDDQGKESMNFQITATIIFLVLGILSFLLIGIPFLIAYAIFWLVVVIIASVRANEGKLYRYPLTIRFLN